MTASKSNVPRHPDGGELFSLNHVSRLTGLSETEIRTRSSAGQFPEPIPLGPWDFGWPEARIQEWLKQNGR